MPQNREQFEEENPGLKQEMMMEEAIASAELAGATMPQNNDWKFQECDSCIVKPGSPDLCNGCIHNRKVISQFQSQLDAQKAKFLKAVEGMKDTYGFCASSWFLPTQCESCGANEADYHKGDCIKLKNIIHNQALEDIKLKIEKLWTE